MPVAIDIPGVGKVTLHQLVEVGTIGLPVRALSEMSMSSSGTVEMVVVRVSGSRIELNTPSFHLEKPVVLTHDQAAEADVTPLTDGSETVPQWGH